MREAEIAPQLGDEHELLPDGRSSALESRVDPALEAVGAIIGTRTAEGKASSSRNGYKGGERDMLRTLAKLLRSATPA